MLGKFLVRETDDFSIVIDCQDQTHPIRITDVKKTEASSSQMKNKYTLPVQDNYYHTNINTRFKNK